MSDKQIFAALEVADHEVRLIVGEFFNTRFNIIKVERVPVNGLGIGTVEDKDSVTASIEQAVHESEKSIGAKIKKVILGFPSWGMARKTVKSTVEITGIDGTITVQDIREAINKARKVKIGNNFALIQTDCVKYTVNGISSRRIPIGEKARELTVEIDLIFGNKNMAFDLFKCVENAGLEVMDIYLDVYGVAKEAALFEQSVDQNIIILKTENGTTTLGALIAGRMNSAIVEPKGINYFVEPIIEQYGLASVDACELLKYSIKVDQKVFSDNPIFVWQSEGKPTQISEKQLWEAIQPRVEEWLDSMAKLCSPILQAGRTTVIITGTGGEMQGLNTLLQKRLNCEVRNYVPETLGGRNAGLTGCLGLFYAYKDKLPITGYTDNSLDMDAFTKAVSYREVRANGGTEDTITKKLRTILFDGKK